MADHTYRLSPPTGSAKSVGGPTISSFRLALHMIQKFGIKNHAEAEPFPKHCCVLDASPNSQSQALMESADLEASMATDSVV